MNMLDDQHEYHLTRDDLANGGYDRREIQHDKPRLSRLPNGRTELDKLTQAQMKARIAYLYREDETLDDIAKKVSHEFNLEQTLHPNSISYHVQQMIRYWRDKGQLHIDDKMAMVLARLDQIEILATEAYFASMRGKSTTYYEKMISKMKSPSMKKHLKDVIISERLDEDEKFRAKKGKKKRKNKHQNYLEDDEGLGEVLLDTQEKIKEWDRHEENAAGDPRFLTIMLQISEQRAKLWGLFNHAKMTNADQDMAKLPDNERAQRLAAILQTAMTRARLEDNQTNLALASPLGGFKEGDAPSEMIDIEAKKIEDDDSDFDLGPEDDDDEDSIQWN